MISSGEEKAWEILRKLDPVLVSKNASVVFNQSGKAFTVRSFSQDFLVDIENKTIKSHDPAGNDILSRYGYFFIHCCIWYLIHAKDIPPTGRLVKPNNIKGGETFFQGSHTLPLHTVAYKYRDAREAFLQKGMELGAEQMEHGDCSIRLLPMPRMPVIIILWLKDDEFPARADLLLDSSCDLQMPLDIIWSFTMLSLLVML
jgi:hypothetical protein